METWQERDIARQKTGKRLLGGIGTGTGIAATIIGYFIIRRSRSKQVDIDRGEVKSLYYDLLDPHVVVYMPKAGFDQDIIITGEEYGSLVIGSGVACIKMSTTLWPKNEWWEIARPIQKVAGSPYPGTRLNI